MINTYHTSFNPPPVPPRQGHKGPVLTTNQYLVKFLSVMVLLLMLITFGGFLFLFHRISTDSNMLKQVQHCMQDNLRREDLQYCRILTEFYRFASQKVSQEEGKMAPLTGTKSPIIRAQLVLFKTILQPNTPNTLAWDIKHSELEEVTLSMSGVLTITHTGYYFIHSQVTFSKSNEKSTLKQTIWRQTPKAEEQAKKEPEELLVSYCSLSRTESTPDLCTSSQTGVFRLEQGQQLFVNVTDIKLVNTDKCKFGLFKLQDAS